MLKSKIARKLFRNFAIALLTFAFIVSSVFFILFRNQTVDMHKKELEGYAQSLADSLSGEEIFESGMGMGMGKGMGMGTNMGMGMSGYGAYLQFISEVSDADVWVVDEQLNLVTIGRGHGGMHGGTPLEYSMEQLPTDATQVIEKVMEGETVFSEGFSGLLSTLTLTVGVPILDGNGDLLGAVLLHTPVVGIETAINRGFVVLAVSILVALLAAVVLALLISYSFTKPLQKMKIAAMSLSQGDYSARSNIIQKDEIGELSNVLDLLAGRLQQSRKESYKLEQMRRDFVANISHELRTPITVIRGSLEALNDKVIDTPEMIEEYYSQMLEEAKFLERLVTDLLDLSRLQNTDFVIYMTPVNICDILEDVTRSALKIAQCKGVSVNIHKQNPCAQMQGDYGRLRQMFMVILDNAIKFSDEGGKVDIIVTENQVSIRDYGPGIDEEHLPYIFDRFYKTHGEQNKSGTGLGLSIAKQIAERHNIKLIADNHSQGGAEFVFQLL